MRSAIIPAVLALCTIAVYAPRLQQVPPFLTNDEVTIALNARSIAASGRDLDGRFMPAWFHSPNILTPTGVRIWPTTQRIEEYVFLPILVYAVAISLKILPFTETAIRLPLVIAAVADVVLVYLIGLQLFRRSRVAVLAAVMLALTPAHFTHARVALPAQISGPFVLGWLLCVLLYFRRNDLRLLFASGVLLGGAAIAYIGPLVAIYGLLTCIALHQRRESWRSYGFLVAGGLLPCFYFVWLARDPTAVHNILVHYQQGNIGVGLLAQAARSASLYWDFWSPEFLFVEGATRYARSAGVIGVFLLPVGGLLVCGIVALARRMSPEATLLLGGFFSAPLPASFVGEERAIWRSLEVAPFGVLLAAYGLYRLLEGETARVRSTVFVATFALSISVAVTYHDNLLHAQPLIRALVVPLAVAGLAILLHGIGNDSLPVGSLSPVLIVALLVVEIVYVTPYATVVNVAVPIVALFSIAAVLAGPRRAQLPPIVVLTLVILLVGEFMYFHLDYPLAHRVWLIPASAIVLALRLAAVAAVLPMLVGLAVVLRRLTAGLVARMQLAIGASLTVVLLQLAYFYVDYFTDYRMRFLHVSAVLLCAVGLAAVLSCVVFDHRTLAGMGVAAVFTAAFVQFGYFYVDYFTGYPLRNVVTTAGNGRLAFEDVIERAGDRPVPSIFVGQVGPYGDAGLYWRFYLLKHHRQDLLARTIEDQPFERNRVRRLPTGSLLVTSPSTETDKVIEQMEAAGEIKRINEGNLIRAPDGVPLFWVLERTAS